MDFGTYCALDPHSQTGSVRPISDRITGSLLSSEGVRLSRLGTHEGTVFDVLLTYIPEGEPDSKSEQCDNGSCLSPQICSTNEKTLSFKVSIGSRASIELSLVEAGTSTPFSIPGAYMSVFDLDGRARDSPLGMAEAVAFRGSSAQVAEYYCTSCGPSIPGDTANASSLWVVDSSGGLEFSARTYMTDDSNGAGSGDVVGTRRSPPNCPNCIADDFSDMYGQLWSAQALAASITVKLVGPFSSVLLDASRSLGATPSNTTTTMVFNGPGPLVGCS